MFEIDRHTRSPDAVSDQRQPAGRRRVAPDMTWIAGGTFQMGSAAFYPEERPVQAVTVGGFWIDQCAVTNEEFARFVEDTGQVTIAERALSAEDFPGAPPENLVPGSLVFQKRDGPVDLRNYANWWAWVPGASWRHPRARTYKQTHPEAGDSRFLVARSSAGNRERRHKSCAADADCTPIVGLSRRFKTAHHELVSRSRHSVGCARQTIALINR